MDREGDALMYTSKVVRVSRRVLVVLILSLIHVFGVVRLHLWKYWIRVREDTDRDPRGWW